MKSIIPKFLITAALVATPLIMVSEASARRSHSSVGTSYGSHSRHGSFHLSYSSRGHYYGHGRHGYFGRSHCYSPFYRDYGFYGPSFYNHSYYRPSYRPTRHYTSASIHVSSGTPYVGAYYSVLPRGFRRCYVGGVAYFSHGGHYYRPYNSGYIVVADPYVSESRPTTVERRSINTKYDSYPRIWVSGEEYLIDEAELFKITSDGLVWAELPMGSVASSLPTHASSVWYKEVEYFEAGGLYFQRVPEGYRIISPPWEKEY